VAGGPRGHAMLARTVRTIHRPSPVAVSRVSHGIDHSSIALQSALCIGLRHGLSDPARQNKR